MTKKKSRTLIPLNPSYSSAKTEPQPENWQLEDDEVEVLDITPLEISDEESVFATLKAKHTVQTPVAKPSSMPLSMWGFAIMNSSLIIAAGFLALYLVAEEDISIWLHAIPTVMFVCGFIMWYLNKNTN